MSAVNRPVDLKQKEKDVNNKLQIYGIVEAFSNGKVPSNSQIDVALNSALAHRTLNSPSKKLSPEGQSLVTDLKNVIEQAKILLLTKNEGNLLQDFIWQAEHVSAAGTNRPNAPVDKDTARQDGNNALEGLRTLGTLLISNGQFRKLLSDATVLLRDMAGDAAMNTANKVKPSEDRLNRLDEPAEDNTWHDTSNLNRENFRNQAKSSLPFGNKNKGDLKETAKDVNQAANPEGVRDPTHTADLAATEGQTGQSTGLDVRSGVDAAKQKVDANTSDEDKQIVRARREQLNNYLKGKMPEERREQTRWRLKKMIVEIQGHQDYQRAIETLLDLAERYSSHGRILSQQGKGSVQGAHQDDALTTAEADLRGFVLEDRFNAEWNQLYDDGHHFFRDRYRGHTDRIADEFKFIGQQFDADPQNRQFAESVNKLFRDLGQDENGKTVFKPHLVKDMTDVILPAIFENVRYIPVPRIEYSDPMVDAVIENLVIEGDNLAPNSLEFGSDNYWRWGRKSITSTNKNKVMLSVSGVQMDLRDVSYYIKRKQGFPSITDKGVMDIFMGGSGFSFKVEMETADKAREHAQTHFFKVTKVESDIKHLQIKMKKSNHKLLFNMFKPLLLKVMRPVIQKVLEKQIKDSANQLDAILFDIKTEADRAAAEAKNNPDPQNIQNIYQRYASSAQRRLMQGKQKKESLQEKVKDTKVNVAVTQHDSIFKNISLPGGISSKATEYKELAAKGDKWESPIFSIGSAKETTSLPQVGKITRKPHGRAEGYGTSGDASRGLGASSGLNPSTNQYDSQYTNNGGLGAQPGLTTGNQGLTGGVAAQPGLTTGNQGLTGGGAAPSGATSGFGNQVDDAFNTTGSTGLNNAAAMPPTAGQTGAAAPDQYNTTFGDQNPVFQGRA
ncbi:hypothetical protein GGP41_003871 [Bipolaris sorokiniana]|uniref:Uncharacterized protein n=1 Tax=Cochliobolus sativus TaxID=45130 RepID=A0A8H5ZDX8_COCSA|nr:hypothetical protein GGP41_003871 [Bipolaris sorokiniana]